MNDNFENISIEEIFKEIIKNHIKKRKSKEERERKKVERKIDKENYKSLMIDRFCTLNGLRDEVYTLIYNYDILNFEYNLKALDEIYQKEDIELLEAIRKDCKELIQIHKNSIVSNEEIISYKSIEKIVYKSFEKLKLYSSKQSIINFLEVNNIEIQNILNEIKTSDESERVSQALISSEHITLLPKSYLTAKKDKAKAKRRKLKENRKYTFIPTTYQQALRRNRHFLEEDLKEIGVGQQRAIKISSLLNYL